MSFYKYQSAIGGEKEREILVFVYMEYTHFWCVVVSFSVSHKRKNTHESSFYRCFHKIVLQDFIMHLCLVQL